MYLVNKTISIPVSEPYSPIPVSFLLSMCIMKCSGIVALNQGMSPANVQATQINGSTFIAIQGMLIPTTAVTVNKTR